jgi:hypothetical protein
MKRGDGPRYVYFAVAGAKVKIGCSTQPMHRLDQIGEWVPYRIHLAATMPGGFDLESALHRMFADSWSHLEWFDATPDLMAFIARVAAGLPVEIIDRPGADTARQEAISEKRRLTGRISRAEYHAWGAKMYPERNARRLRDYPEAQAAMDSYASSHVARPSAEAVAVLERYIAMLESVEPWSRPSPSTTDIAA